MYCYTQMECQHISCEVKSLLAESYLHIYMLTELQILSEDA